MADMTGRLSPALLMKWMRRRAWRASVSLGLTVASVCANLSAFIMSMRIPSGASEVNPLVHPGTLSSLAYSEGLIILISFALSTLLRDEGKRSVILAAVVALLTGDALNDIVFSFTGSQFLAADISYASTALIPAFVAMKCIQSHAG